MNSYSVRCIFLWEPRHDQKLRNLYEERITLWQADSFDTAMVLAEEEAKNYASVDMKYLGHAQIYHLVDPININGVEVFSLLRESNLDPNEYITAFFDNDNERQSTL